MRRLKGIGTLLCVATFVVACGQAIRPDAGDGTGGDGIGTDGIVGDTGPDGGGDTGDDAQPDVKIPDAQPGDADDVPTPTDADDVPTPMDADDAPTPTDVPVVDVPGVDVPVMDVPPVDVPAVDVPPIDAGACPFPVVRALTLPMDTASGNLMGMSRIPSGTCAAAGGPEQLYTLRVTAMTNVQLETSGPVDTVLSIRRNACDSQMAEVACNDDIMGGVLPSRIRTTLMPGDYYVIVDTYGTGMGGMYTLNLSTWSTAANSTCATAGTLTPGTTAMGNTLQGGPPSTACATGSNGPQLFYSLTVPAGQRATVTATPSGMPGWTGVVRVLDACGATTCRSNTASAAPNGPASTTVDNRGAGPITVFVSVSSTTPVAGGPFTLSATLSALPPVAANSTCSMATMVTDGTMLPAENAAAGMDRLNATCLGGAQGTVLYYRATIPPRNTLVVTATPAGMWDPTIRVLSMCGATTCLASSNAAGNGAAETQTFSNPGATAQTVIVAVGSNDAVTTGSFALRAQLVPPPSNTTCASATNVMDGTALTNQNSALGTENLTAACLPASTGTVLYYRVTIPPGQSLQARATPVGMMDVTIRLLSACGVTTCLNNANAGGGGAVETLRYTNSTMSNQTLILGVGGNTNGTNGMFNLSILVRRNYTLSMTPVMCDDMTGAPALAGVTGDDTVSAITDLPFRINFYGEDELEFSASSNGLVQLWPTLTGAPSNSFDNVAIPTAAVPNRFLAALWDDLIPVMGSSVQTRTFGTAPNRRFVIAWTNYSIFMDTTARLTFQVKLFETTNVIEYHYCTLTPGMMAGRHTGGGASIGIENQDGSLGVQHSLNMAGAVNTTTALRFTP